ncbi:MAG: hypothetical protein A2901_02855 [Elusimicrobia bacterium RIFCSPLOWO2_01_FULL_54_10]|nr:MAG: hypothetical protein A2901_02855 [Elusimicrobia bacterium RIFCSPLOWO2_01_FULL_54_10]
MNKIIVFMLGMVQINCFVNIVQAEDKSRNILILFVHGLGSNATKAFTNTKTGTFWPMLMAKDVELEHLNISTATFIYNSSLLKKGLNIEEIANHFSNYLKLKNQFDDIYIVSHSLGGLLTLISLGNLKEENMDIYSHIRAIFLSGVPFRGSDYVQKQWVKISPNVHFKDIGIIDHNKYLQAQEYKWRRIIKERDNNNNQFPRIYAAYETRKQWFRIAVPRVLIFPFVDENPLALEQNHKQMAKPRDSNDQLHQWVRDRIKQIDFEISHFSIDTSKTENALIILENFENEIDWNIRMSSNIHTNALIFKGNNSSFIGLFKYDYAPKALDQIKRKAMRDGIMAVQSSMESANTIINHINGMAKNYENLEAYENFMSLKKLSYEKLFEINEDVWKNLQYLKIHMKQTK